MSAEATRVIHDAINEQIKQEHYSAELYYAMAAHCASISLPGVARWFRARAADEQIHAMQMTHFVTQRGGTAMFRSLGEPPSHFDTLPNMIQQALRREQFTTAWLESITSFAAKQRDLAAQGLLQRCLEQQKEEEQRFLRLQQLLSVLGKGERIPAMVDEEIGRNADEQAQDTAP